VPPETPSAPRLPATSPPVVRADAPADVRRAANARPRRVLHIINNLEVGGAEAMLERLLGQVDGGEWDSRVVSLIRRGDIGSRLAESGIPVEALGLQRRPCGPKAVLRLTQAVRRHRPDLVQTWLYHSDLLGGIATRLTGRRTPVVWNVRHSGLDRRIDKRTTRWTVRACARLSSRLPAAIVCNSKSGAEAHRRLGYNAARMLFIPNGFDLDLCLPSPDARQAIRRELGIPHDARVVGLVGRFHPQKDHAGFIAAAARIAQRLPAAHFVLCGKEVTWENSELRDAIRQTGLRRQFRLLGLRHDTPRLHAACDLAVSASSCGEGFSNALGEAMACGVPCVATDVGDSARLLGETGRVVPPRQPEPLAAACLELLQLEPAARRALGRHARQRIATHFTLSDVAARYTQLWQEILAAPAGRRRPPLREAA